MNSAWQSCEHFSAMGSDPMGRSASDCIVRTVTFGPDPSEEPADENIAR